MEVSDMRNIALAVGIFVLFAVAATADEYAPGRIIMKIEPDMAQKIIDRSSTGNALLDDAIADMRIVHIRRLARRRTDSVNLELRRQLETDGIIAIRYDADIDPMEIVNRLSGLPGIRYVQPDHYTEPLDVPNDPLLGEQYAMELMQMADAWDVEKGDEEVIIAISDTGTDWNHPDMESNIYINEDEDINGNGRFDNYAASQGGDLDGIDDDGNGYIDDVIGWDFITGEFPVEGEDGYPPDPDPMDFGGHGTNTAGIAGAVTDNNVDVAGTAWYCSIMPLKVLYEAAQGSGGIESDRVESFYYAADNDVDILSMSWRCTDSEAFRDAATYAHAADVFLCASAGNDNSDNNQTPSSYLEILSVAATQQGDLKADFSNYGSWVGIAAPGVDIVTLAYDDSVEYAFGGTSASCPYVAGVAGLVRSRFPELSNTEVYYRLTGTADQIDLVNPLYRGKLGSGRVNGYRALTEEPHPTLRLVEVVVDDTTGGNGDGLLSPGETALLSFKVRNFWIPATGVSGYVSSSDPSVSVDSLAGIEFGYIETDSTVLCMDGIPVSVAPTADIGYFANFVLRLETDGGYEELQPFGVPVAIQTFADISSVLGYQSSGQTHTVAFADFDGDGDQDFYRANWSFDHGLYRNDGSTLTDVTNAWNLPLTGKGQGASWGDYDNDGDPDLIHGTMNGIALFRNDGETTGFVDVTAEAGFSADQTKNFTPVWGDYNNDGFLDLFVAYQDQSNQLYQNNGDGTFTDVSISSGLNSECSSYAASWADFDRDGDIDLFVSNCGHQFDGETNALYVNNGDGTFTDCALELGLGEQALVSTGGIWGDYDADGWVDLYVTNIGISFNGGQPNKLFRNIHGRGFVRQRWSGLEDIRSSAGASWGDFDGDGLIDLYVSNTQRNALYRNFGNGVFGDATESSMITDRGWVSAWVDFDEDGDEDLYVGRGGADLILSNLTDPGTAIHVRLTGAHGLWGSPADALGSIVTLYGESGSISRVIGEGAGLGQNSHILTFPLVTAGSNPHLRIEWASGTLQDVTIGQETEIAVMEERPIHDLGLRAHVLPLAEAPAYTTVSGVVAIQDNGTGSSGDAIVSLDVTTLQGDPVYSDTIIVPVSTMLVDFPIVPVPLAGDIFQMRYGVSSQGDSDTWNDEIFSFLSSGSAIHDFEIPPVYWELTPGWRRATSAGPRPAAQGDGYLYLGPGEEGVYSAAMPPLSFDCNCYVDVRFQSMYSLEDDTVWVSASSAGEIVAQKAITGSQPDYAWDLLRINTSVCAGRISVVFHCARVGTTSDDWFVCIDSVEPVVGSSGDDDPALPSAFIIKGPWPNPASTSLNWTVGISTTESIDVEVFNIAGQKIYGTRWNEMRPGNHTVPMNLDGFTNGVYVTTFKTKSRSVSRSFVYLR